MTSSPRFDATRAWSVWGTLWLLSVAAGVVALCAGPGSMRAAVLVFCFAAMVQCGWPSTAAPRLMQRTILCVSLLAHLTCLWLPPLLSDDVYRYLVDGSLVAQGYNPFGWAPSSPKLDDLVPAWRHLVNHPDLHTIYPPVAQAAFGVVCLVASHPLAWKSAMVFAVWGTAFWCWRRGDRDSALRLVSHPLVLLGASLDGHVDTLGIMLVAALLASPGSVIRSGVWIGLAAGVKLFPLALVAASLRFGVRKTIVVGVLATSILVASYLPLLNAGAKSLGSLGIYAATWEYNSGPAALVSEAVQSGLSWSGVPGPTEVTTLYAETGRRPATRYFQGVATARVWWTHRELGHRASRIAALMALFSVVLAVWRHRWPIEKAAAWLLTVVIVTSPTVHPWYMMWLVPLAVQTGAPLWLRWLCAVHVLGFWAPAQESDLGVWQDERWIRSLVWGTWALVCAVSVLRRKLPGTPTTTC